MNPNSWATKVRDRLEDEYLNAIERNHRRVILSLSVSEAIALDALLTRESLQINK